MKAKKVLYSILLVLFSLLLAADLCIYFFVPETKAAETVTTDRAEQFFTTVPSGETGTAPDESSSSGGEGFSMPGESSSMGGEGFSMPDESSSSGGEGFSMPNGTSSQDESSSFGGEGNGPSMTPPSGNAVPSTADSAPAQAEAASGTASVLQAILPDWLWTAVTFVRPYWLWILIGSALGVVLCVLRLIFLARKSRKLKAAQPEGTEEATPARRRVAVWPAILLLLGAMVLVAVLFPADSTESSSDAVAQLEVLSGTVTRGTLNETLIGAGYLEEQGSETVTLPASVELSAVAVRNGDAVTKGQILAKVNKTSVMVAIADIEDAIASIDSQLQDAHDAVGETMLKAAAAGTVKVVYASVGDDAADVMAEYGSLMLLSLDGRMSVEIPAADGLSAATALYVTLSDGTVVSGEITDRSEDTVTVCVLDKNYPIGESVSVSDANGTLYGSGTLSVHRPLNVTHYLGTVTRIYRAEGSSVASGTVLIGLSDAADTAEYRTLLGQRAEYEDALKELFELYQNEYIIAPADGVVSGISDDIPYKEVSALLSDDTEIRFVSTTPQDAVPGNYVHYVGQVTANDAGTLSLNIGMNAVTITDYTDVDALLNTERSLSGTYTVPATVPVYAYTETWESIPTLSIAAGDLVVFTFDQSGTLVWVICYPSAAPTPTPSPSPSPSPTPDPNAMPGGDNTGGFPGTGDNTGGFPSTGGSTGGFPSTGGSTGGYSGGYSFQIPSGTSGSVASVPSTQKNLLNTQTLLSVTPQETMTLSITVDELDILSVTVGQSVSLYLDSTPGTHFAATVTEIDQEGANSGGNTKFTVKVATARTDSMRAGMNGTVVFTGAAHEAVLLVPVAALCEDGNSVTVYTGYDAEADALLNPVPVTTGLSDGTNVEIVSGLNEGDTYYYRYADSVSYTTTN